MKIIKLLLKGLGLLVLIAVSAFSFFVYRVSQDRLSESIPEIDTQREARLLTAFFGRDSDLPLSALILYRKALNKDGMPLVFSQEVDPSTLEVNDFEVTTQNGDKFMAEHATLMPANEEFELRTVLLIGEYGDHPENPPVSVEVVGDLKTRSGQQLKGQSIGVIPLPDGPVISYAEHFTIDEDYPYVKRGRGCDCPREETQLVVRAVWSGGVRALDGRELGNPELDRFEVELLQGQDTIKVQPYKLADLGDNDNNIDLCLEEKGLPLSVRVKANTAIDPNDDKNPMTEAPVLSRW